MQFRLLGPLEVAAVGGEQVRVVRPKLRLLLAVLLSRANTWLSVDSLVDDLWGAEAPRSAVSNVRTYVWSLRRLLAPADPATAPISTDQRGYMIHVSPECLDVFTFERLLADGTDAGHRGDLELAAGSLAAALALWRGNAFQDVPFTTGTLVTLAERLEEQRLTAVEELFDIRLMQGRHAGMVSELRSLTGHHPLRERLWGQLMLALYRDGRQAEALAAYQRLRTHLVTRIGVEPSPPLQTLQSQILRSDPALARIPHAPSAAAPQVMTSPMPQQLPLSVPTFVGRSAELSALHGLLAVDGGHDAGPVVVIHGPPGAGKSALAVHAANRWSARFPDGQLYVNLRGATPGVEPLHPGDVLGQILRALGAAAAEVPRNTDEAAALYRTHVATRQMVILLDNAATVAQVRPLLPGTSRTVVLVTSRASLSVLEGATLLGLGPLDPASSQAMLERLIGDPRPASEPSAIGRLAELCGHLPLGLHVAAARLKVRPSWSVQRLVDRLTDERYRLTELTAGDLAVRSSLQVSYAALQSSEDPDERAAARTLRLIGSLPVTTIDSGLVAALLDTGPDQADSVIERLLDAHLIEAGGQDRHQLHDLVRLFTRDLAADITPDDAAIAATTRLFGYYVATAVVATRMVYPKRTHYSGPEVSAAPKVFTDTTEARCWLETERANLLTVARQLRRGPDEHARLAVGLALALHWFLGMEGYPHDMIELNEHAIELARRLGDRRSEAYANGSIAGALRMVGRIEEAEAHLAMELSICRELGDRFGEQRALGNLGFTYSLHDRPGEAIACLEQQLKIARQIGAAIGEVFALSGLGRAYHQLRRYDEAIRLTEQVLAWYERTGDDYNGYGALERLGLIYLDLGRLTEAADLLTQALDRARRISFSSGKVETLLGLARVCRLRGATDTALGHVEEALAIANTLGLIRLRSRAEEERTAALDCLRRS